MLDLVRVQEVRWERDVTEPKGEYKFFCAKGNKNNELGTCFFVRVYKRIILTFMRLDFVSDGMSYIKVAGVISLL
jgi:hypothetical protein